MMAPRSDETNTRVRLANERELVRQRKKHRQSVERWCIYRHWRCVGEHVCSVPSFHRFIDLVLDSHRRRAEEEKTLSWIKQFFSSFIHCRNMCSPRKGHKVAIAYFPLCKCRKPCSDPIRNRLHFHSILLTFFSFILRFSCALGFRESSQSHRNEIPRIFCSDFRLRLLQPFFLVERGEKLLENIQYRNITGEPAKKILIYTKCV